MSKADRDAINQVFSNVGKVLEAYQRRLIPGTSPFDRYVAALGAGDPEGGGHLSKSAQRGLRAFMGDAQCINCHNGPLLTDMTFHNLGLPRLPEAVGKPDLGRTLGSVDVLASPFNCRGGYSDAPPDARCDELTYLNPRFEDFRGAFKTPTLRNVAKTAPYMHDGRFRSLEEVLGFYKSLPGEPELGHRELVLELLDADVSSADLVAFLESLTGPLPDATWLEPQ
ncbi:MAG: cytochrome-c peroxidase, partial [Myxococcota bacterium]